MHIKVKPNGPQTEPAFGDFGTYEIAAEAKSIDISRSNILLRDYLSRSRLVFEIVVISLDDVEMIELAVKRLRSFENIEVIL